MKKLFISLLCFMGLTLANAQTPDDNSYLGIKAGVNLSTNTFDPALDDDFDVTFKTGFAGGLFANIGITDKISLQPEILYSQMGSTLTESHGDGNESTLDLHYFSGVLLFKFMAIKNLGVFLGPQLDIMYRAKVDNPEDGNHDIREQVTNSDIGGTIGLEYWFTKNIGIYGRYMIGFTDINEKNPGFNLGHHVVTSETRNTGFQVGITIGIRGSVAETMSDFPVAPVDTDKDHDGVMDSNDKCPDKAGIAKYNGCPIPDTDGDGVDDEKDLCPQMAGLASANGCPDTDGDGVSDDKDKCPKTAGLAENLGCPQIVIYYAREEESLDSTDKANLEVAVQFLLNNPDVNVVIEGHTSTSGQPEFNNALSEKRANNIMQYFISRGAKAERMTAKGYGEQYPIGDNATDEGRMKSRRVVIKAVQ